MGATIDKIKGKAKQIEGKLTGNELLVARGIVEKTKGDIEGTASRVARKVKRTVRRAKAEIARVDRRTRVG